MMEGLRKLIRPYLVAMAGPGQPLTALADDLEARIKKNDAYLRVYAGMLLALFGVLLSLVVIFHDQLKLISVILAGDGILIVACLNRMRDIWRAKGAAAVVIVIVRHLPASEAKLALQKFLDSLTGRLPSPKAHVASSSAPKRDSRRARVKS
jgi:hypothetical protein